MSGFLDPSSVVQRQLDAYNAKDIDALLAVYAEDAELYEYPATLLARGAEEIRTRYGVRFGEPNLHARLIDRMPGGSFVVDRETVTRTFPEGPGEIDLVMIYEVRDGRIARAWSIAGKKSIF